MYEAYDMSEKQPTATQQTTLLNKELRSIQTGASLTRLIEGNLAH